MNKFIPAHIIQSILSQNDIIDVIKNKIHLKKVGKYYSAICPFHNDHNPSLIINHEKQYFYCFGCNTYGNVIDFIIKYDGVTFLECIKQLAKMCKISIDNQYYNTQDQKIYNETKKLYKTMKLISNIYHENIQSNQNNRMKSYLKERKINQDMINYFKIGFSSKDVIEIYIKKNQTTCNIEDIYNSGVVIADNNKIKYDRFNNRIIFPITNQNGKVIGFGGRSIYNQSPKYINSPTTKIFNKSHQLYGIYEVKKLNPHPKYILVVEGYFDVISLVRNNIKYVVAILGSVISNHQINMLFQMTNNIIFCYDGDESGKSSTWKSAKMLLPYINDHNDVKFILLPDGQDPDNTINIEGELKFKNRIQNAISIFDIFFDYLIKDINLSSIDGKNQLLNQAIPLINKIPSKYKKIYLQNKLGKKIGIIDTYQLDTIVNLPKYNQSINTFKTSKKKKYNNIYILISLIIQNPSLVQIIPYSISEFKKININGLPLFIEIFNICKIYNNIHIGGLIEFYRNNQVSFNIIKKLSYWNNMIDEKNIDVVFIDLIKKIYNLALERKYDHLISKDRKKQLNDMEKDILWDINQTLSKK